MSSSNDKLSAEIDLEEQGSNDSDFDYLDGYDGTYDDDFSYEESESNIPEFSVYTVDDVNQFLRKSAESVSTVLMVELRYAMTLLSLHSWDADHVVDRYTSACYTPFVHSPGVPEGLEIGAADTLNLDSLRLDGSFGNLSAATQASSSESISCSICCASADSAEHNFSQLPCSHIFCNQCWKLYIETQVNLGKSIKMTCMETKCQQPVPKSFVLSVMGDSEFIVKRYQKLEFDEFVSTHPNLRFCNGPDCIYVIYANERKPICVRCNCGSEFCFSCGETYHAPASCDAMKKWLVEFQPIFDSHLSDTDMYIATSTKDCPNCAFTIKWRRFRGLITCSNCNHKFCWVCLDDWKSCAKHHRAGKCRPNREADAKRSSALDASKGHSRYAKGWLAQTRSLTQEKEDKRIIELNVARLLEEMKATFIDCEYRHTAMKLLTECRRVLKYSYVYANYMDDDYRRTLFEGLQHRLLKTVEDIREQLVDGIPRELEMRKNVETAKSLLERLLKFASD